MNKCSRYRNSKSINVIQVDSLILFGFFKVVISISDMDKEEEQSFAKYVVTTAIGFGKRNLLN